MTTLSATGPPRRQYRRGAGAEPNQFLGDIVIGVNEPGIGADGFEQRAGRNAGCGRWIEVDFEFVHLPKLLGDKVRTVGAVKLRMFQRRVDSAVRQSN